jgi:cellulose synthase (UDP-forming)
VLTAVVGGVLSYAVAGALGRVPWGTSPGSTVAAGVWLALASAVLVCGTMRIRAVEFATSRRNAHRIAIPAPVAVDGVEGQLVDVAVGGAAVRFPRGTLPRVGLVVVELPGAAPIKMELVRTRPTPDGDDVGSLKVTPGDWLAYGVMSRWLFHTPAGAVPGLPAGVPAAAVTTRA